MERIVKLLSGWPIGVHYWFADWVIFPLVYYIVRFRRKLVRKNLTVCFPDRSTKEIHRIEKAFYHHLADMVVEVVYGYGLSEKDMRERVQFEQNEEVNRLVNTYGSVIVMLAHLGNWEWFTDYHRQYLEPAGMIQANVYRKQANKTVDKLMGILRSKHGGVLIDKQKILRQMITLRNEGKKIVYGLICDQKPRPEVARYWCDFLHHDTGFLDGGEVLSKKFGYPVLYAHIHSPKRGYYVVRFEVLAEHPKETAENEITALYAKRLEANILEQPQQWLWTHKRWKRGRIKV